MRWACQVAHGPGDSGGVSCSPSDVEAPSQSCSASSCVVEHWLVRSSPLSAATSDVVQPVRPPSLELRSACSEHDEKGHVCRPGATEFDVQRHAILGSGRLHFLILGQWTGNDEKHGRLGGRGTEDECPCLSASTSLGRPLWGIRRFGPAPGPGGHAPWLLGTLPR